MNRRLMVFTIAAISLILSEALFAEPKLMNYQGVLRESNIPASGPREFQFRIRNGDGGAVQWQSNRTVISVSTGIFSTTLGTTNDPALGTFSAIDWNGISAFLEVNVGPVGGPYVDLAPQERLVSTAYSIVAGTAAHATSATALVRGIKDVRVLSAVGTTVDPALGAWIDAPEMTITFTLPGPADVLLMASLGIKNTGTEVNAAGRFMIDGVAAAGSERAAAFPTSQRENITLLHPVTLGAGAHTVKAQWLGGAGTTGDGNLRSMSVILVER